MTGSSSNDPEDSSEADSDNEGIFAFCGEDEDGTDSEAVSECEEGQESQGMSKRAKHMDVPANELFPQVFGEGLAASIHDPALRDCVEMHGMHGLMLLSKSLEFKALDASDWDEDRMELVTCLRELVQQIDSSTEDPYNKLQAKLGQPLACFETIPSPSEKRAAAGIFDAAYDFTRRDFCQLSTPKGKGEPVVLGVYRDEANGELVFSLRLGPARGPVVHDCTSFAPAENLVGPALSTFTFAECFESGALAKPRIALSARGILRLPQNDAEALQEALYEWTGVRPSKKQDGGGVTIPDPRTVMFQPRFSNGKKVVASAHDYHCAAHLLDLFNPTDEGVVPVKKAIMFCPNNKNSIVILQRWGRCLRPGPGKWGTLALPCFDPYDPDEDQMAEWERILGEEVPDKDLRSEMHTHFDLICRLAECAVDPGNLVLGRLISVVTGYMRGTRQPSGVNRDTVEEGEDPKQARKDPKPLQSLLTMMISKRALL
ncbi:hypothetical protein OEZ85_002345 [Tetradesmus obliquus]|uniref:ATP-dependent helicase C-terminal domain-containing protein n=1 Tax=Tetradesmus obliquus TaxID=3088 RepID=A0ABY8U3C7_TETOB|nr:hypothetical protein OEZ85_002345 [Tetradesmus obliquus]